MCGQRLNHLIVRHIKNMWMESQCVECCAFPVVYIQFKNSNLSLALMCSSVSTRVSNNLHSMIQFCVELKMIPICIVETCSAFCEFIFESLWTRTRFIIRHSRIRVFKTIVFLLFFQICDQFVFIWNVIGLHNINKQNRVIFCCCDLFGDIERMFTIQIKNILLSIQKSQLKNHPTCYLVLLRKVLELMTQFRKIFWGEYLQVQGL